MDTGVKNPHKLMRLIGALCLCAIPVIVIIVMKLNQSPINYSSFQIQDIKRLSFTENVGTVSDCFKNVVYESKQYPVNYCIYYGQDFGNLPQKCDIEGLPVQFCTFTFYNEKINSLSYKISPTITEDKMSQIISQITQIYGEADYGFEASGFGEMKWQNEQHPYYIVIWKSSNDTVIMVASNAYDWMN